jgi:predicted NAD-dependent protein-ADP-ribosyltransferase YbiA (DUF1768 family)
MLVEKLSRFGDNKWGVLKSGKGANLLGQVLMHVREEVQSVM